MKGALRLSMAWLHTWLGVLFGWVLYFMFVTGTTGYIDTEIDRWMRPELPVAQYPLPAESTAERAMEFMQSHAHDARRWVIQLPLDRNEPYLRVSWESADTASTGLRSAWLDAGTGQAYFVRDTAGGQALYQMHWRLRYLPERLAEWIVSVASMVLFLILLTGIIVHRRFFADFFTFRPGKGQRSWLDAHNVVSVASMPFQLMISYSGLIFVMFSMMPLIATGWYEPPVSSAVRKFYGELFPPMSTSQAAHQAASMVPVNQIIGDARRRWGYADVAALEIDNPGDTQARIIVIGNFAAGPVLSAGILVYDGVSGDLLAERPLRESVPRASRNLMMGLHEGLFAPPVLRVLYVLSALAGCLMIATGMVLWTVKRRERAERGRNVQHAGLRWVERLNVAVIIGLPVAMAAYLWANRLLPIGLEQRAQWEMHVLFLAWLAMFVHAACMPPQRGWSVQAWLAAIGFGALPLLNFFTTDRHLGRSLAAGDWVMAGFDLGALALGMALAAWAHRLGRKG